MTTGSPRRRPRVLIATGDPGLATTLQQQLAALGLDVAATVARADAVAVQVETLHADVALVDAALPGTPGGLEVAQALQHARGQTSGDAPAVILLTTSEGYDAVVEACAARPIAMLVAPFAPHHLRTLIDMTLLVDEVVRERRRTEADMRLQSVALEATVNSVVITDTSGTIVWVNQAFCNITGYTRDEVLGQNPRVLKSGRQSPEYYADMWRSVSSGRSWRGEFVNRRKDGSHYTEDVTITPVTDDAGTVTHYIAIKQDISALKQSLAHLEQAHLELNEKNEALDAALVEARAAVEAKATFLATMSHEIRTPMNGVIGMASLLRETEPLTDEQLDYIETIRLSGDTLLTIINDVLDFSKVESGHMELERVPFDLRRCVEETLETLAPRAREKQLELAIDIAETVPTGIVGDGVRLRQVLTNLVGNAVKFTDTGEVVVEVRSEPLADERVRLSIRVRDTGIGIPRDKRDRLFRSFSQVDSSTTRVYGGTGLGLAISQRLVGLMGGTIEVDSVPGEGSVFYFDIVVPVANDVQAISDGFPDALLGRIVLIVDDNATNRRIFSKQLRQAHCVTAEATSGAEALAWLADHRWPDLIVSDMLMPGMDGVDFALNVRALEREHQIEPPVPIILASSGGYQPSDPRVASAAFSATLLKPLQQRQLLEAVSRACSGVPAGRPARVLNQGAAAAQVSQARRVLLAEDNPVNRKVALAMLGRLGYAADTATNGLEAVEACAAHDYDVVLMDVQMPELDGLEATRRLRALPGPRPLVVAMTAHAMEGDREACLAAGMDDYVSKPVSLDDLRRVLAVTSPLSSMT